MDPGCDENTDQCLCRDDEMCDDHDICTGLESCGPNGICTRNLRSDCNENGIEDSCDVSALGDFDDCNGNAVPDECELRDKLIGANNSFVIELDPGTGRGVMAEGTFHIEMYQLGRSEDGELTRTLVSDWHYPTSDVHTIAKPGMLGDGYFLHLMWATKEIAGKEIEIITQFEDAQGHTVRSETKRFRVPKYTA